MIHRTAVVSFFIALAIGLFSVNCLFAGELVFACSRDNDLYRVVSETTGKSPARFDTSAEALEHAPVGSAVLILADGYPQTTTDLPATVTEVVKKKKLRLYVEYPTALEGLDFGKPQPGGHDRAVIASDFFGPALPELRILAINGLQVLPVEAKNASIVAARVAGFDKAVYGLPEQTRPILFTCCEDRILVATTKLSHFVTGRYAPQDAWKVIWQGVLKWLRPEDPPLELTWKPTTLPAYGRTCPLPTDYQRQAVRSGAEWFEKSKLLLHPSRVEAWKKVVAKPAFPATIATPPTNAPVGDGSLGILEAPLSILQQDGSQLQSVAIRADCCTESAMALATNSKVSGNDRHMKIAKNLLDFVYFTSDACKGDRADPNHPAYGHVAWGTTGNWLYSNYGDDNARVILATIVVAALSGEDRWDESIMRCLLANLRTTGPHGFRLNNIPVGKLAERGWKYYYRYPFYYPSGHYQSYLWACYLWAYDKTGDKIFLDTAKRGIKEFMRVYPEGVRWTNGLAQERARIILPLAWLLRVENTPENRKLFDEAIDGLLSLQVPCGTIREEIGPLGNGRFPPPSSNKEYGGYEASLIQENGDPVADMLYTANFAILGLREASGATNNDPKVRQAEDRLAEFLCRIQVRSKAHPSLDGGWFRTFDFRRWEFWGSNADVGWGAWCMESGWTNGWVTAVLAMREMDTTLWDITKDYKIQKAHDKYREKMLPQAFVDADKPKIPNFIKHGAEQKKVKLACPPSPAYPGNGSASLTDGILATGGHYDKNWLGFEGKDLEAIIDMGSSIRINNIRVNCLQKQSVGIFLPAKVEFAVSEDGKDFSSVGTVTNNISPDKFGEFTRVFSADSLRKNGRFVRVRVKNLGTIPSWHRNAGGKSWLFVDEIVINQQL